MHSRQTHTHTRENQRPIHSEREVRRSFALAILNGSLFRLAEALIDPPLVLTWFVSRLTDSNLLIGMIVPLGNASWFLPQLFFSARVHQMKRKMRVYTMTAVVRTIIWIALAVAVWLTDAPLPLLIGVFIFYVAARMAAGPAGLAFFDIVAKTVPPRRRGRLFAWRLFLGGILGLGGGWVVNTVLNHPLLPFPRGHALLFLLYTVVFVPACVAFIAIREPPGIAASERPALREQLRRAKQILAEDGVYRRFLIIKVVMALAGTALPFYGVYAKNVLGAPEGMVGIYITTRIAAQLLFNLPWGWLSDRRGNRLALRLQIVVTGLTLLSALVLVSFVALSHPQGAWLPYLALPLFFLDGALLPTYILTGNNFLLELVPEAKRPLYLGLNNTLMGIVILISGFGGLVVDLLGFGGLFAASLALCLVGFALTTGLPEPRENERVSE